MAAESLVARLGGAPGEREAAYAELLALELEHSRAALASVSARGAAGSRAAGEARARADVAVACVVPLCQVLCKPVADIGVAEWHRVCKVLTAIIMTDRARVGCEMLRPGQTNMIEFFSAPENALGVALAKEPSSLTVEDALTVAWAVSPWYAIMTGPGGLDVVVEAAGLTMDAFIGALMPHHFLVGGLGGPTQSDDRNLALIPLYIDMLKTLEELPEFVLGAIIMAMVFCTQGRNAIAVQIVEHDGIAVITDLLRQITPSEVSNATSFSNCNANCQDTPRPRAKLTYGKSFRLARQRRGVLAATARGFILCNGRRDTGHPEYWDGSYVAVTGEWLH